MASRTHDQRDRDTGPEAGRTADSPTEIPPRGWKQVALRTWKESSEDNISIVAAGVAFYGFLALVPLLGAIVLTYGIAADPQTVVGNVKSLTSIMPTEVAKLIGQQLMSIVHSSGSKKGIGLVVAIAVALWGARNAATSIITALNIAYEEKETRSTIRVNLLALAITAGGVVMAVVALLAITAVGYLEKLLPHLPEPLLFAGKLLSYAVLLLGAAAAAATLYRYAPSRHEAKWKWITPGSIFASILWVALTFGFGFYVAHFGNYNKTYGSLATVVIFVTWLYFSAYVFLLSAELNSELEVQTTRDTTKAGGKPLGERGASPADRVAKGEAQPKAGDGEMGPRQHQQPQEQQCAERTAGDGDSPMRDYWAARATNRAAMVAGLRKVGMISTALSTIGLSLLRRKGREVAGAAILATAVGLSLLKREE